jgi:hypothetical protein
MLPASIANPSPLRVLRTYSDPALSRTHAAVHHYRESVRDRPLRTPGVLEHHGALSTVQISFCACSPRCADGTAAPYVFQFPGTGNYHQAARLGVLALTALLVVVAVRAFL